MDKEWAADGGKCREAEYVREDSLDAVIREIKEETGVDVTEAEGGYAFSYKRVNPEEKKQLLCGYLQIYSGF